MTDDNLMLTWYKESNHLVAILRDIRTELDKIKLFSSEETSEQQAKACQAIHEILEEAGY